FDSFFFFSSRRRHTRSKRDWSSDVCSSDLRVQFHFKLKEIKVPKFEFEWNYLLNEVISSLSPDVLEELKYYYKDDETTIKAVSELIQIYLLNYMDNNTLKN